MLTSSFLTIRQIERAREAWLNIDGRIETTDKGDLTRTYTNMLACINGITEPVAKAIVARYPTFRQLYQAFRTSSAPKTALKGIAVRSKRIYTCVWIYADTCLVDVAGSDRLAKKPMGQLRTEKSVRHKARESGFSSTTNDLGSNSLATCLVFVHNSVLVA